MTFKSDSNLRNPEDFGKVVVIYGGNSNEREISLESGQSVLSSLKKSGVDVFGWDPNQESIKCILNQDIDRAFIALHGANGEDGRIQGLLDFLNIPFTGSGMFSSAVAMSKVLSKKIFLEHNLPTPKFKVIRTLKDLKEAADIFGFPIVLKPNSEGSSLGMSKISKLNEIEDAYKAAIEFDDILLAEEFIQGKEITVTILKNKTLPTIRVKTNRNFYDYFAKYKSNKTEYICPGTSDISEEEIYANIALEAFEALHCSGWGRVDFMCEKNNSPKILEINTVPGMTKKSLVPMSAMCEGIDFETLCLTILETSF
mgnify:FL=1|tara:strand:- start:234 stop:1172 length:939 start_codon:yes stop_codon:yes gene_type:complete